MNKYKEIVIFDFETTGLSSLEDEILEIGAIKLVNDNGEFVIKEELSEILLTTNEISEKITEITGITTQMQTDKGISQEEGFYKLSNMITKDTLLIAYNIQFDLSFLLAFYQRYYNKNYQITNDVLDVMAVYKDRHRFPHRLESAIEKYSINFPNTHRALDDCKATYAVLLAMKEERDVISRYVNKIGFNKKYGVSGPRLPHVIYIPQYGGYLEIENFKKA